MKSIARLILIFTIAMLAFPVSAQDYASFTERLRSNLNDQSSQAMVETIEPSNQVSGTEPALGSAEDVQVSVGNTEQQSLPFNAGRDTVSGLIAAGAAILGALLVILIVIFVMFSGFGSGSEKD
jgi:predicted PurR-regulated permease PerM